MTQKHVIHTLNIIVIVVLVLVIFLSLGGFVEDWNWRLAWYSNPRPHFVLVSLVALGWLLWRRNSPMVGAAVATILLNLAVIAPLFWGTSTAPDGSPTFTVAHLNTNRGQAKLSTLNDRPVDILLLQEVTPNLDEQLSTLLPAYDVIHRHPLTNTHGSAVLVQKESSVEVRQSDIIHLPQSSKRPLILTDLQVGHQIIQVLSLHLTRPHHARVDVFQRRELEAVAQWSQELQQDEDVEVMIIGDFNVTPWAQRFFRLLHTGQLTNSMRGYGVQNTWPSNFPLALGIPIDHAVQSDGLIPTARTVDVVEGTDHGVLRISWAVR